MLASRGSALSPANVFPDTAITLNTFTKGTPNVVGVGNVLPSTISFSRIIANVITSYDTENAWTITVAATMSNGDACNFVVTIPDNIHESLPYPVDFTALSCAPTTANIAGQPTITVTSTTGVDIDHAMMLIDPAFTTALTTDLIWTGTANTFYIDPSQVGYFEPGDAVTLDDDISSATDDDRTIVDIDYRTGLVTLSGTTLAGAYTVAQHAVIFFTTSKAEGYGRVEIATVNSFVPSTSITFDSNLGNSYGVSAKVYPLVKSVTTITQGSNGTADDEVEILTQADRLINRLNTGLSI
jgi:hypothetical protein